MTHLVTGYYRIHTYLDPVYAKIVHVEVNRADDKIIYTLDSGRRGTDVLSYIEAHYLSRYIPISSIRKRKETT